MSKLHLFLSNLGETEITLAKSVISFLAKLKTLASTAQVEEIMSMFPSGTAIDTACITLCNEAISAISSINSTNIQNASNQVSGLWTKLATDLTQINHGSIDPKHNFGFYLKCVGCVLEDLANSL